MHGTESPAAAPHTGDPRVPLRAAPETFAGFRASQSSRTPAQILAHIGDLMDWALSIARGKQRWHDSAPLEWNAEVERFHTACRTFDEYLASDAPLSVSPEKLFQGPIADALTHTGQIALLRRMAGTPVRGENYYVAHIEAGRLGPEQAAAVKEFE